MRATIALLAMFSACVSSHPMYRLTKTGPTGAAKPATCDFKIATTKVDRPYDEIAILDRWGDSVSDAAAFKEKVGAQVCEIGGDAVIAEVNSDGNYVRGTVLKWQDAEAAK